MKEKKHIFIGGLHRSGTSLLHEILKSHEDISGFENTGVLEDEGQHLQSVYPPAANFGGPGRFGLDSRSFMDETHPLATINSSEKLTKEWGHYWDTKKQYLIEKSPPNIVRTRFLDKLFPGSLFIILLRHPVAVAYATKKWTKRNKIPFMIESNLRCYERFLQDINSINNVRVLRYEEFILDPNHYIKVLLHWIGLSSFEFKNEVRKNVNQKYFSMWDSDLNLRRNRLFFNTSNKLLNFEKRVNLLGYSWRNPEVLLPIHWGGTKVL